MRAAGSRIVRQHDRNRTVRFARVALIPSRREISKYRHLHRGGAFLRRNLVFNSRHPSARGKMRSSSRAAEARINGKAQKTREETHLHEIASCGVDAVRNESSAVCRFKENLTGRGKDSTCRGGEREGRDQPVRISRENEKRGKRGGTVKKKTPRGRCRKLREQAKW